MYIKRNREARSRYNCRRRKATNITSYEYCQLWTVGGLRYFCTLSHKRRDFLKTFTEYKICVLIFSITFV